MLKRITINDPNRFFLDLGCLHDASVENFSWNEKNKILSLSIDDLNSNFLDLPEYQGLDPADIEFLNAKNININIQIVDDVLSIYDMKILQEKEEYEIEIYFSPGGYCKFTCKKVELRKRGGA